MKNKIYKMYLKPAFVVCVVVLLLAVTFKSMAISHFGVYFTKKPLPLRKSLQLLDENGLGDYKVLARRKIPDEIVKSLGTNDYIEWVLEDESLPANSPMRNCSLFVTYYQTPDRVPHVPEECYVGGGFQRVSSKAENVKIVDGTDEFNIPIRYLEFAGKSKGLFEIVTKFPVMYFFSVNGTLGNSRQDARLQLNKNLFGKYSYFSKVEWKFFNRTATGTTIYPNKKDSIKASQKLLQTVVPILQKHWPSDEELKK